MASTSSTRGSSWAPATASPGTRSAARPNLEGRLPDPDAVDEVFLSARAAELNGLEVGDHYTGRILSDELFVGARAGGERGGGPRPPEQRRASASGSSSRSSASVRYFDEVVVDSGFSTGSMLVTPAFWEAYDQPSAGFYGAFVDLRPGVEVDDFRAAVEATVPGETIAFQTRRSIEAQAERAIRPQVAALRVFTLVAGLIGLVIVGQAISRRLQLDAITYAPLRALGLTERQRAALALARTAVAATRGRPARGGDRGGRLTHRPGGRGPRRRADARVPRRVGGGPRRRRTRGRHGDGDRGLARDRVDPCPRAASSAGFGLGVGGGRRLLPVVVAGTRFALDPGPANVPTRSTLVGAATAVVLVVATLTFAASLDNFIDSPRLYGTPWDAVVSVEGDDRGGARGRRSARGRRGRARRGRGLRAAHARPGRARRHLVCRPWPSRPSPEPIQPTLLAGRGPARPTTRWPWGR